MITIYLGIWAKAKNINFYLQFSNAPLLLFQSINSKVYLDFLSSKNSEEELFSIKKDSKIRN